MTKWLATCGIALAALLPAAHAQWNLPYARPAKYDFSGSYSPVLVEGLKAEPNFLRDEMKRAWTYYKTTFIMANGLVNHRKKINGQVTGASEAVSEGQGYGMLLAVIMNDQPTFNRIFEAANQYMWKADKKSLFVWDWPSGKTGAATDADLDYGLALVFADELRKKGLWQAYDKAGITYASRAMEVIRSIRQNMTSQDYLLPGDNWGGDGVNNLNPSYFATANLKVFNAYQKEVDFTPVIRNCYAVLKKTSAQYQKGQAPDWITKDGNQAGGRSRDMLDDAIRTPWRMAMDALWFQDPAAVEFCRNSKNTLTQYGNANPNLLINQMGHYKADGSLITGSSGLDRIAMWATAALASGDKPYSQKVVGRDVVLRIIGDKMTGGLGSTSLSETDFYYKQSLAMLGLATLSGQFPNILEDMKGPVNPVALAPLRGRTPGEPRDGVAVAFGPLVRVYGVAEGSRDWGSARAVGLDGRWKTYPAGRFQDMGGRPADGAARGN